MAVQGSDNPTKFREEWDKQTEGKWSKAVYSDKGIHRVPFTEKTIKINMIIAYGINCYLFDVQQAYF